MARTISQTINLQSSDSASKYITDITDRGITIHPLDWQQNSSYIQLDGTGMSIMDTSSNANVAEFSANGIRIGETEKTYVKVTNNNFTFNKKIIDNTIETPFKVQISDEAGVKQLSATLGSASYNSSWTFTLPYTPTLGTEIVLRQTTSGFGTFVAGTQKTIAPITYDGNKTFTKVSQSSGPTNGTFYAYYLIRTLNADLQVGTRTLTIGSAVIYDTFPRYTIGDGIISLEANSLAVGRYNDLIYDGLFMVGNGTGHFHRSNAFVVNVNGMAFSDDYSFVLSDYETANTVDKKLYDAMSRLGWTDCIVYLLE